MISKEAAIKRFVENYEMEVPGNQVEEEFQISLMDMRHRMTYAGMGGGPQLNPFEQRAALEEMKEELRAAAYYNVKEDLVMKKLMDSGDFSVSGEELQNFAEEMIRRQNTDMEMLRRFFGEDLAMLERDVKRRKVEDWICAQIIE